MSSSPSEIFAQDRNANENNLPFPKHDDRGKGLVMMDIIYKVAAYGDDNKH